LRKISGEMIRTIESLVAGGCHTPPMNFVGVNAMFCIVTNTHPTMLQNYTAQDAAATSVDGKWQMAKFVWKIFHVVIIK